MIGRPVEAGFEKLPATLSGNIQKITEKALMASMLQRAATM
jgi:hypothetical protein